MEELVSRFNGDDYDQNFPNEGDLWNANLIRHMRGRAGQAVLRELREALLSLPEKRLINGRLADESGCVCTVGALAAHRGVSLKELADRIKVDYEGYPFDEWDAEEATLNEGLRIGLKTGMVVRLASINDDTWGPGIHETPEQRYERVLKWVESKIIPELVT